MRPEWRSKNRTLNRETFVMRQDIVPNRRFPPPWSVEELNDACFVVIDSAGMG
jgi:hypothetical protein